MDEAAGGALASQEDIEKEERIKRLTPFAKDVVMVLVKTIKATKMYLPNNPIYQKFREELKEKLDVYFMDEEYLSLVVNQLELTFLDQQVYQNPDKDDNIALMFFKDGVREFCFHKGITPGEIDGFIDILKFDYKGRDLDDDLVTLLWEKDFQYVTYTVTDEATEEEAEEQSTLFSFDEEPEAPGRIEELKARVSSDTGGAHAAAAGEGGASAEAAGLSRPPVDEGDGYERIRGTFKPPDDLSLLAELTDIFCEILVTEPEREHFDAVGETLSKALDIFVQRGDLALATILVMKLQELAGDPRLAGRSDGIERIIDRASSGDLVRKVGQYIGQGGLGAMESAGSYLGQLDARAIGPTIALLEDLENMKARKAICDILAMQCGGDGKLLTPFLGHRHWFVVRNLVMVLGKVADPDTVEALGGVLGHDEARVRREAAYALAAIKGGKAEDLLALSISDKDRGVRALSARLLIEQAPEKAYERLVAAVADKGFTGRDFEEKKEMFELLGRSGGAKAVPYFAVQFKKKGIWNSQKRDKARALAAYGLAAAGGEEAYELLQSGIDAKSKEIRTACIEGLRRIKR
jgi:hypothetical protein